MATIDTHPDAAAPLELVWALGGGGVTTYYLGRPQAIRREPLLWTFTLVDEGGLELLLAASRPTFDTLALLRGLLVGGDEAAGATPLAVGEVVERIVAAAHANLAYDVGLDPDACAALGELLDACAHANSRELPRLLAELPPPYDDEDEELLLEDELAVRAQRQVRRQVRDRRKAARSARRRNRRR